LIDAGGSPTSDTFESVVLAMLSRSARQTGAVADADRYAAAARVAVKNSQEGDEVELLLSVGTQPGGHDDAQTLV
jgi:hypothetical protein